MTTKGLNSNGTSNYEDKSNDKSNDNYKSKDNSKSNTKQPTKKPFKRLLEFRTRIKELFLAGKTPIEICNVLNRPRQTVYTHIKNMLAEGELQPNQTTYNSRTGPPEERRRYKIIERTLEELSFYIKQELVPTARKMGYRLIELAVAAKKEGKYLIGLGLPDLPDPTDKNYQKEKKRFFDDFYKDSAEARRGVDNTYTKTGRFPKLPIDCFRDDNREAIGDTAMWEPSEPTADEPPEDPFEVAEDAILQCKNAILNYDGLCYEGEDGVNPGRWYKQPIYCEVWCESEAIQPDLLKFQHGRYVIVAASRGFPSTPFIYESCKRLKETAEKYDWIEKIVILYFGDSDKSGNYIRRNIERGLKWYQGSSKDLRIPVEVELRLVAIKPDQVKKFKLTGYQLEAFMTTEARLKVFKKILLDAINGCFDNNIYLENCPDEKYDYEANGEEEPTDIDPDEPDPDDSDSDLTIRQKMAQKITDAFVTGWLSLSLKKVNDDLDEEKDSR